MKIFISYRRDDTAGRAGRLFDVLVTRFGARNVFQDVTAIEPGSDFTQRVDDAIAQSNAALVVIGPDWLTMRGPDGTPRLDEPDDYVRREVSAALAAGVRVVPVLVDRAELPAAADLPESMRPLVTRQAVTLRDATWHQDVDALIRRLEGEDLIDSPRRRWPAAGAAAVALVAAVLGGWIWLANDDDGGADSSDPELPPCSEPTASWSSVEVRDGATALQRLDGQSFAYTVRRADYQIQESDTVIILRAEMANETEQATDEQEDPSFGQDVFDELLVDGVSQSPSCFRLVGGDSNMEPGDRAIALVGFESTEDPTGAQLVLKTNDGVEIEVTSAG